MDLLREIFGSALLLPKDDFGNAKGKVCSVEEEQPIELPLQEETNPTQNNETVLELSDIEFILEDIDYYYEDIEDDYDDLGSFETFLDTEEDMDAILYNHKRLGKIQRSKKSTKKEKINPDRYQHHRTPYKTARQSAVNIKSSVDDRFGFHRCDAPSSAPVSSSQEQRILQQVLRESERQYHNAVASSTASLAVNASSSVMNQLLALQTRELTPEDYEILLLLDQSVKPKTLSKEKVNTFPCVILDCDCEDTCTICMTTYEKGESQKTLPCGHKFHTPCIDHWLTNSSVKCPLDGRELL